MDGYPYPYPGDPRSVTRATMPPPPPPPPAFYNTYMRQHPSSSTQQAFYQTHPVSPLPAYPASQLPFPPVYMQPHLHQHQQLQQQQQQQQQQHLPPQQQHPPPPQQQPQQQQLHQQQRHPQLQYPQLGQSLHQSLQQQHPPLHLHLQQHQQRDAPQPAAAAPPDLTSMIRPLMMPVEPVASTANAPETASLTQTDTTVSAPVSMETACVYRKFGEVIKAAGKIEATHEVVLNVFLQLSKKERKLVMAEGSIRSFLSKCTYIVVNGNTLSMTEPLPSKPQEVKKDVPVFDVKKDAPMCDIKKEAPVRDVKKDVKTEAPVFDERVFKCKESRLELFEDRAYRCGISLEKEMEMEEEDSSQSESLASHCQPHPKMTAARWPGQMTNGLGTSVCTTKWSVGGGELTETPLTHQMLASKDPNANTTHRTSTRLTYAADYKNRLSESEAPDECVTRIPNDTGHFVDMQSAIEQFKETLFVKSFDPIDTMAKRLVYNAMCGALATVTKSQESAQKRNHVLRVESSTFVPRTNSALGINITNSSNRLSAGSPEFKPRNAVSLEQGIVGNAVSRRADSSPVRRGICTAPTLRLQRCVSTYHCGIQTDTPPTSSVMTNTRSRRTKDCATQTDNLPKACSDVAINTVDSMFDRRFRYRLMPVVATKDACVDTPKIHTRNIKSQCSVTCEDGSTMTAENRPRTVSVMEDSSILSSAAMIRRDSEQSTDSTELLDVSVQPSAKALKEMAYKKQPPGLPNIQQPVKKSKKAKALKAKTPAVKAEVSPDEFTDSRPTHTATVPPTHPITAVQSHRPEPPAAEVSTDPLVTTVADMTVSTTVPLQPPTDPLLLHMMRMLEQANPALSRDPQLLQMTAMRHMMALQQMQQQQQMQLQWASSQQQQQQRSVEMDVSSQSGVVDISSTPEPTPQPEIVAPQEPPEPAPADLSHSRPPLHWPSQARPTELAQEPAPRPIVKQQKQELAQPRPTQQAAPTQVKPSKQKQVAATEPAQRATKRHPSGQADVPVPAPAPSIDKQKVVLTTPDDVKTAAKVPSFLGRQRKAVTAATPTNAFNSSRNYGDDSVTSGDVGGENWDSEVDPYATTWTWGQGSTQVPEPVKEPPKPPIPGLLQKASKKKTAATQDANPVKATQAPPTQVPPSTQAPTRPGNFFKKPPTPTLIPITRSSWDEAEPQLNLTDSSAFPGLPSHRQQKKAAVSSSVSELSDISLKSAATNSVSALCDIPISSTSASAVGFSVVADSLLGGKQAGDMLDDFDLTGRTNWQPVVGKKKKIEQSDKLMNSFDKLVAKLKDMHPEASQAVLHDAIKQVRQKHAGLKGVHMSQVISDASKIIGTARADSVGQEGGDASDPMNKLNYKTRICQFWQQGTCVQGDQCGYAHGKKQLRQMPRKTQMCQNVLKGYCQYGDQCTFAHSEDELKRSKPAPQQVKPAAALPKVLRPMKTAEPTPAPTKTPSWGGWSDTSGSRPTHVTELDEAEDVECVICCDGIKPKDSKRLECGHVFHDGCIRQWVLGVGTRTCPTCRSHALLVEDFPKLG